MSYLAKIFKIDRKGINLTRGLEVTGVLLVLFVVLIAIDQQKYYLTVFTFSGMGIGVLVMFLAHLLQKRTAKVAPQASAHEGRAG